MRFNSLAVILGSGALAACTADAPWQTTGSGWILNFAVEVTAGPPATAKPGAVIPLSFLASANWSNGSIIHVREHEAWFDAHVTAGGGTVNIPTIWSAADGSGSLTWTLGPETGVQSIRVSVNGNGAAGYVDVAVTVQP